MANSFSLPLTPAQVETMKTKAHAVGIDPDRAYGTLPEQHGVVLDYQVTYIDNGSAVLTFTVKEKPMLVSTGMIENRIKALLGI